MASFQAENFHPGLSIDCVIFGFHENELKVLLLKMNNLEVWALPGGFVQKNKDVNSEAARILSSRTGLEDIFLRQFCVFGDIHRNQPSHASKMVENKVIPKELQKWFEQRFVSVGYYALVEYSHVQQPTPDATSESCEWCSLNALPELILDHKKILAKAHEILKRELSFQPIGLNLLPEQFTLPELQSLYETILEESLDRRNFRRKILGYGILHPTGNRRTGGPHKAPMLYEFDKEKYSRAIASGLKSGW